MFMPSVAPTYVWADILEVENGRAQTAAHHITNTNWARLKPHT